jgi:hypothetical protein
MEMTSDDKDKRLFIWDNKLSLRDIILCGTVIGGGVLALATLQQTVAIQANDTKHLERRVDGNDRALERIESKIDRLIERFLPNK